MNTLNRHYRSARTFVPVIALVICILTFYLPPSVQAGLMQWSVVDTPGSINNVIVKPSEVNAIAVSPDGVTCFAVDVPHSKIYRSNDGGLKWDDITVFLTGAGAVMPAWDVTIAPDNPNFIAVVTSSGGLPGNVFISNDGGSQWFNANYNVPGNIGAIDISPNYGSHDIVVGTRDGAGGGSVNILSVPGPGSWADQGFTGDVIAVACSPTYASDNSLVIVSADGTGTYADIGIHDTTNNTTTWGILGPMEITTAGAGTSPKTNQILTADIELPLDFSGQIAALRRIYISTNDAGASGNAGLYRIDDNIIYKIMPPGGINMISSIAYYGTYNSGKLLVGEVKSNASLATVDVWICSNPGATCPQLTCLIWQKAVKPPTGGAGSGNANAQIAWISDGTRAYCGTSSANLDAVGWPAGYLTAQALDESAFSYTVDTGATWNQISLIDTEINFLSDVASTITTDVLYLASINTNGGLNGFDSLWRSTTYPQGRVWERVLCVLVTSNDFIIRIGHGPSIPHVFLAARATSDLYQSADMGQTWNKVLPGVNITDFILTQFSGVLNLFILDNNSMRSGEYLGQIWKWRPKSNTSLSSGHTIEATNTGIVVIGDAGGGNVAYSTDGGFQFTSLQQVPDPGNMHVGIDPRTSNYIVIYAGSDAATGRMYAWAIGLSNSWSFMASPGQSYYGIVPTLTLYCAWSDGAGSAVDRTLNPLAIQLPNIEWSTMDVGLTPGVVFTREPSSLKAAYGVNLWAIDNRPYTANTGLLWNYTDGLAPSPRPISPQQQAMLHQPPIPVLPETNATISVSAVTGRIADIEFVWKHPTTAVGYEIWIAEDKEFTRIALKESITPVIPAAPEWTLNCDKCPLETDKTYYWKVRVNRDATYERVNGQWSQTMTFTVEPSQVPEVIHPAPALLNPADDEIVFDPSPEFSWTPVPGATRYKFVLAEDESLTETVLGRNVSTAALRYTADLKVGTTYYWQVQAIEPFQSPISPVFSFTVSDGEQITPPPPPPQTVDMSIGLWIAIGVLVVLLIIAGIVILILKKKK
jgi:hypothetical protein